MARACDRLHIQMKREVVFLTTKKPFGDRFIKSNRSPDLSQQTGGEKTKKHSADKHSTEQRRKNPRPAQAKGTTASTQSNAAGRTTAPKIQYRPKPTNLAVASPSKPVTPKTTTHWGEVAEWYDKHVGEEGSDYHQEVILPGVMRLLELGKLAPEKPQILDIACGQGVLCRALAKAGCQVTGIDAAAELIAVALRRNATDRLPIEYRIGDATKIIDGIGKTDDSFKVNSLDAVTIVLSIQNMNPLSPIWHAVWALLKPKGRMVVVMMHPCFRVPQHSAWQWDQQIGEQHRLVRQYLRSTEIGITTHPGDAARGLGSSTTTHFHRPLQSYVNTMGNAGLYVDHIEEWTSHRTDQPSAKKAALDKARKEIPLFMAIRARKL